MQKKPYIKILYHFHDIETKGKQGKWSGYKLVVSHNKVHTFSFF